MNELRYKMKIVVSILGLMIALVYNSSGQGVSVIAQATKNSIQLRWAADNPLLWSKANEYGYTLERYTLYIDGKIQSPAPKIIIRPEGFRPSALAGWEAYIEQDDYIPIAAQAIYGETFELDAGAGFKELIEKANENESRFSFALFAADQSVKAAELSGLYYEDQQVVSGYQYLYKVYANVPSSYTQADTGYVYIGLDDYKTLPKVPNVQVLFDDKMAMVSWNVEIYNDTYSSYWLEKSVDGGPFSKTSDRPFVSTYKEKDASSRRTFIVDSLDNNYQKVKYRVRGVNSFGNEGEPSEIVSGHGLPVFAYAPAITSYDNLQDKEIIVHWDFPNVSDYMMKSFTLKRLIDEDKFETVIDDIDFKERKITDTSPKASNYYVIFANDKYGRSTKSFPYFVQLEDSIPPVAPVGLTGRIDSVGRVFLDWDDNQERDLKGYYVFRSHFKSKQFLQLPGELTTTSDFMDSIDVMNLTKKIYYKVQARDLRSNPSELSAMLTLVKPDKIPPVPAVFSEIKKDNKGIHISWNNSSSEDVAAHLLYRKEKESTDWSLVKEFFVEDSVTYFMDQDVLHGTWYSYTLLAIDENGLESIPTPALNVNYKKKNPYPDIVNIFDKLNREKNEITVAWEYEAYPQILEFQLYRKVNDGELNYHKTLPPSQRSYDDKYTGAAEMISYYVVAQFKDGYKTGLKKELKVKIIE